jgi:ribosomal protein S18 acetylase RimI-like enzyme
MAVPDGVEVRRFRDCDREHLIALWREVLPSAAPHNESALSLRRKLEVDDLIFVAVEDGRLVGAVMGGYDGHRGWVYSLAVAPGRRRRGIGSALAACLERELARRGCMKVNLQVRLTNEAVTAFYRGLGYAVEERVSMGKTLYDEGPPA